MTKIKIGSDFSGVGAFNQALIRLGIAYEEVFACDMDKYARQTFVLNYGEPKYYPKDVYEREIPKESLDIYMTSPPCQSFSMAGKRLGKEDQRGILFFNSLEFIRENKPRYFIFENVKGLLSHDKVDKNQEFGRTFQEWINYLGGKSINGVHTFFPYEDAVPYHIYFQVLNAKHYGIPQNRERIFIIGIRDDEDNDFQFPKPFPLEKRLKDVLETEVDEKYFLSDSNIKALLKYNERQIENDRGFSAKFRNPDEIEIMDALKVGGGGKDDLIKIGTWRTHEDGKGFREMDDELCPTIPARAREDGSGQPVIKVNSNFGNKRLDETLNSKEVPEEDCIIDSYNKTFHTEVSPCISTRTNASSCTHVKIGAIRGRNPENPKSRQSGLETEQMLEINENGTSNALTTVQKDNVVVISANTSKGYDEAEEEEDSINFSNPNSETRRGRVGHGVAQTLDTSCNQGVVVRVVPEMVNVRKFEVDIIGLQKLLKTSKEKISIKDIANILELPKTKVEHWFRKDKSFSIPDAEYWFKLKEILFITETKFDKSIMTFEEKESVFEKSNRVYEDFGIAPTLTCVSADERIITQQRIRRLTPFECFRLMDFNENFKWNVSDSQAYKQAGNSICVGVLVEIIKKLKL